jgi:hypothetical protein
MKMTPILMTGTNVNRILDGSKTMTRRVVKQFPASGYRWGGWILDPQSERGMATVVPESNMQYMAQGQIKARCPYGQPGDRLWVRESWSMEADISSSLGNTTDADYRIVYRASESNSNCDKRLHYSGPIDKDPYIKLYDRQIGDWRPSIFMPRWASRITLEITAVRAERLQDISEEDARAEGVRYLGFDYGMGVELFENYNKARNQIRYVLSARHSFETLWDSINAAPKPIYEKKCIVSYVSYPWDDIQETREYRGKPWVIQGNPFVFPITFKKIEAANA